MILTGQPSGYDLYTKKPLWRKQDLSVFFSPQIYKGVLYVPTSNNGLIGYQEKSGKEVFALHKYKSIGDILIYNDIIYLNSLTNNMLVAFDLNKKTILWAKNDIATNGLSTDGENLYFSNRGTGAFAVNLLNGNTIWETKDIPVYSYVTIDKTQAYFNCITPDALGVCAVDKKNGALLWFKSLADINNTLLALAVKNNAVIAAVVSNSSTKQNKRNGVYALDAVSGKNLWFFPCKPQGSPIIIANHIYFNTQDKLVVLDLKTGKKLSSITAEASHLKIFDIVSYKSNILLHGINTIKIIN